MRSILFVIPMIKILSSCSTPSILAKSWLTTLSHTPVSPWEEPLCLQIASISSKMMMWSPDWSPFSFCSASASAKSSLIFYSEPPTYLSKISGPEIDFGFQQFKASEILLAINVFPVPGGPWSRIPFTCVWPYFFNTAGGYLLLLNAFLKMTSAYASRPPIPSFTKSKSPLNISHSCISSSSIWISPFDF